MDLIPIWTLTLSLGYGVTANIAASQSIPSSAAARGSIPRIRIFSFFLKQAQTIMNCNGKKSTALSSVVIQGKEVYVSVSQWTKSHLKQNVSS
jgi:hypothetical protein